MENKYPKLVVGAFIFNDSGELFLRTTPNQDNKYTCVNGKIEWGQTIFETLKNNVKAKTNLDIKEATLIGLTDGLDIPPDSVHLVFADYKVLVNNINDFKTDESREYKWLPLGEWLKMDKNIFGPYIYEIIEKLNS